jgi:segregation and condensation protein B
VPPWERQQRPPDRAYQAAATDAEQPDEDEDESAAGLSEDDDDFDEAFEGPNPEGYVPVELPPMPGESGGTVTVDAPAELPEDAGADATDVGGMPEVPIPDAVEAAVADADEDEPGRAVDAPLPPDGDDAGEVFDAAADDDMSDDEIDLPFAEEVPGADRGAGRDDVVQAAGEVLGAFTAGQADVAAALGGGELTLDAPGAVVPAQGRVRRRGGAAVGELDGRTEEEVDVEVAPLEDAELRAALEAILLVVDEPVAEMQLAQIMEQPAERVATMLEDISARYTAAGHGFDLRRAAGGWRLYTRPEYATYVERFVLDGQSVRLTQAALETLAVVAYKQPVTRSRISAIRGVNCDGVMRTLVTRGLIEECGTESETGAFLYRTTPLFLEKLGLNAVDQLPPLAPFLPDDVEEVLDASG